MSPRERHMKKTTGKTKIRAIESNFCPDEFKTCRWSDTQLLFHLTVIAIWIHIANGYPARSKRVISDSRHIQCLRPVLLSILLPLPAFGFGSCHIPIQWPEYIAQYMWIYRPQNFPFLVEFSFYHFGLSGFSFCHNDDLIFNSINNYKKLYIHDWPWKKILWLIQSFLNSMTTIHEIWRRQEFKWAHKTRDKTYNDTNGRLPRLWWKYDGCSGTFFHIQNLIISMGVVIFQCHEETNCQPSVKSTANRPIHAFQVDWQYSLRDFSHHKSILSQTTVF